MLTETNGIAVGLADNFCLAYLPTIRGTAIGNAGIVISGFCNLCC